MSKKTAKIIVESGNDYVLQVKGNQSNLKRAIRRTIREQDPLDFDYTLEMNRGREEHRAVMVYSAEKESIYEKWYGIKNIIHIKSIGRRGGKEYKENRYYISSKSNTSAAIYNKGIREHWGIENKMHWVKDVIQNEDKSMIRDYIRSENMSVVRNIVINLFRVNGYKSTKYAIEKFSNRLNNSNGW